MPVDNDMPLLVSIILSSYNRPALIRNAIDSVLAQTWPRIQLLVADDYSNEGTLAVIDEYAQASTPSRTVTLVQPASAPTAHDRQFGQRCSVCINAAMHLAQGGYVCFLPDDDMLTRKSIEVRARYLMDHPDVTVVYGRLESCVAEYPVPGMHWLGMPIVGDVMSFPQGTFGGTGCTHDRTGFWNTEPVGRIANKADHGMVMVRRLPNVPDWPETRTAEWVDRSGAKRECVDGECPEGRIRMGERFDCDDAAWYFRLEICGLGPFHSVPDVVVVKRYTNFGHRTDPRRRE